jgi:hypothetical protein
MRLVYDGDFCKGVREGQGTSYEHSGEVYTGCWQQNRRTGPGALALGCCDAHSSARQYLQTCAGLFNKAGRISSSSSMDVLPVLLALVANTILRVIKQKAEQQESAAAACCRAADVPGWQHI